MGADKLDEISEVFAQAGRGSLPAAVISNGSMGNEEIVVGVVNTIAESTHDRKLDSPSLIILGEVVGLHPSFQPIRESYAFAEGLYA